MTRFVKGPRDEAKVLSDEVNVIECHIISLPQVVYLEIVFCSAILQLYLALGSCLHNGRNLIKFEL